MSIEEGFLYGQKRPLKWLGRFRGNGELGLYAKPKRTPFFFKHSQVGKLSVFLNDVDDI